MKKIFRITKHILLVAIVGFSFSSCLDDLDVLPKDSSIITSKYFEENAGAFKQNLGKLYAGLAVSGPNGSGSSDIQGLDNGFGQYMRAYWMLSEVPTDEALLHWSDAGIPELVTCTWGTSNQFIRAMYLRLAYQTLAASEFLRMSADVNTDEVKTFRAEARWLRAFSYVHAIDLFGSFGFIDENLPVGDKPKQKTRAELYNYVESELLAIIPAMKDPRTNEYGRVDKAAAWMLLAKLYLNGQVWAGQDRSADCIAMCENIINAGYSIAPHYNHLFLADNDTNDGKDEYIFTIPQDKDKLQSYGCMNYIIQASTLSDYTKTENVTDENGEVLKDKDGNDSTIIVKLVAMGVGGWNGLSTRKELYNLFGAADKRALFFIGDHSLEIPVLGTDTKVGYGITKFRNVTSTSTSSTNYDFVDTDYPLFRLADVYLMYAEATLRSEGNKATALQYVNELREKHAEIATPITASDLTLDFILDERGRELYCEGWRRQDLIRFGKFSGGDYNWQWKGGMVNGANIPAFRNLYPVPADQLSMNPNLDPTPGYY
jgi:hypothetical protein